MRKCAWCSEPITESRGYKGVPKYSHHPRKGWLHSRCFHEFYDTFGWADAMPQFKGWWGNWWVDKAFEVAVGPLARA